MTIYDEAAPDRLRDAAARWRRAAAELDDLGDSLVRRFDTDLFLGSLADRYREHMGRRREHLRRDAARFGEVAGRLEQAAEDVAATLAAIAEARAAVLAGLGEGVAAPAHAATSTAWLAEVG